MSHESSKPFLEDGERWEGTSFDDSSVDYESRGLNNYRKPKGRTQSIHKLSHTVLLVVHGLILAAYTAIYIFFVLRQEDISDGIGRLTYSPAQSAIEYQVRVVDGLHTDSIFAGNPNPNSDAAWSDLLHGINLRVLPSEMLKLNQKSLNLADGSGSLGTLGVYHELHCIKRLRKWFYKEYYYPNQTEIEEIEHKTHAAHCIELLRQAAVCKGDVSVTAFKWLKQGDNIEPTTKEGAPHQCVNWEKLSGWARARSVNLFDPGLLIKPLDM